LHPPIFINMYTHMKTTIEISDAVLHAAKKRAAQDGTTIRALVEEGLRKVLAERQSASPFRLELPTFRGRGLQPGVREGGWDTIRDAIYEGRGT
jgi:hypothetical protein